MRFTFSLFLAVLIFTFGGCAGYTVGPIKPKPMKQVLRICVKNFKNDTLEPRVSALLANAVIRLMQQDGTYEVTDEAHADAILDGKLDQIQRHPARSLRGNVEQTREYLLTLRANYTVTRTTTGTLLDRRSVNSSTSFFVTGRNLLIADSNQDERQALPLAAEELATRIVSLLSEGW
jgi:hypothetical protein